MQSAIIFCRSFASAGHCKFDGTPYRLTELRIGAWVFRHWTPFNDLTPGEASSPGYRRAVERQHAKPDLPYGLDVHHGGQVLSILWSDDGAMEVAAFIRGPLEEEALAL